MNILILGTIGEFLANLDTFTESILNSLGIWGAGLSCLLIICESMLPFLPLFVFITLIFYTFGNIIGFIVSWVCTCIGCYLSFILFRSKIKDYLDRKFKNKKIYKKINKLENYFNEISLSGLTVLIAMPFTPAFAINIAAGLSDISKKKYAVSLIIGKIFMVYFWGYIGTTLIECFTHPIYLIRIIIMMLIAFMISKIITKRFDIE